MTCFENALRTRRLIYPKFLFDRYLVEMIMFPRSIVLWGKAMYQNAFFILEFSQNLDVIIAGKKAQFEKLVKNSCLRFIYI